MHPKLFDIPLPFGRHLALYSYGLLLAIGFLAAAYAAVRQAKKKNISPNLIWDLWTVSLVAGVVGARIFYVVQYWEDFKGNTWDVFAIWRGGLVFYGGFLAAFAAGVLYLKMKRAPVLAVMDSVTPGLMVGLAFGRVGCFLNGCCFGKRTLFSWGVRFPAGSPAWYRHIEEGLITPGASTSLPVHPTQVYSMLAALALALILYLFSSHKKRDGEVFLLLAVLYPVGRFLIELLRADPPPTAWGLTISQIVSIPVFAVSTALFVIQRMKRPLRETNPDEASG